LLLSKNSTLNLENLDTTVLQFVDKYPSLSFVEMIESLMQLFVLKNEHTNTQIKLAELMNCNTKTVKRMRKGKASKPTIIAFGLVNGFNVYQIQILFFLYGFYLSPMSKHDVSCMEVIHKMNLKNQTSVTRFNIDMYDLGLNEFVK